METQLAEVEKKCRAMMTLSSDQYNIIENQEEQIILLKEQLNEAYDEFRYYRKNAEKR